LTDFDDFFVRRATDVKVVSLLTYDLVTYRRNVERLESPEVTELEHSDYLMEFCRSAFLYIKP
jgi:hypothetical protein